MITNPNPPGGLNPIGLHFKFSREQLQLVIDALNMLTPESMDTAEMREGLVRRLTDVVRQRSCQLDTVINAVAAHFHVSPRVLMGKGRTPKIAFARQVGFYFSRKITQMSYPKIAQHFGDESGYSFNHSSVIHGCQLIEKRIARDFAFAQTMAELGTLIKEAVDEEESRKRASKAALEEYYKGTTLGARQENGARTAEETR